MLLIVDADYREGNTAQVAGVLAEDWFSTEAFSTYKVAVSDVADYVPGQFYLRELPCILQLLEALPEMPDVIVVDGYVDLGSKPGLGRHLFDALGGKVPVVGVAKTPYVSAGGADVIRFRSIRPLIVTSAGIDTAFAATKVRNMAGPYRIPALLKLADTLARSTE